MEFNAFLDLLADGFVGMAIRRIECVVAAESTTSGAYLAIAVRAAKTCVDADFLDTGTELACEVRGVAVKTTIIAPDIHDLFFCKYTKIKFRVESVEFRVVEKFKV